MNKKLGVVFLFLLTISVSAFGQTDIDTLRMNCDSIYKNKHYRITQIPFNREETPEVNTVFVFEVLRDGIFSEIFRDTIYSKMNQVLFADYNNDRVKDVLVQNISDVRSNWTYYLFLVDTANSKLNKINGFEEIKNPKYNSKYNLIENYVMSGTNWTSFYKIKNGKVYDYGITLEDNEEESGKNNYTSECQKALKKINPDLK